MTEDALLAYYDRLRERTLEGYRHEQLLYALRAPHAARKLDPPELPRILREHGDP